MGNHIRLVALAALYIAEKYDGVIVDLLTQSLGRVVAESHFSVANQGKSDAHRASTWKSGGRIRSLGWLKFGLPDVVLRDIPTADIEGARSDAEARESVLVKALNRACLCQD